MCLKLIIIFLAVSEWDRIDFWILGRKGQKEERKKINFYFGWRKTITPTRMFLKPETWFGTFPGLKKKKVNFFAIRPNSRKFKNLNEARKSVEKIKMSDERNEFFNFWNARNRLMCLDAVAISIIMSGSRAKRKFGTFFFLNLRSHGTCFFFFIFQSICKLVRILCGEAYDFLLPISVVIICRINKFNLSSPLMDCGFFFFLLRKIKMMWCQRSGILIKTYFSL